jgi:hypothetical protein
MKAMHLAFVLGAVVGCGGGGGLHYKIDPAATPPVDVVAKPPTCEFTITTAGPTDGAYDNLGTMSPIDFAATSKDDLKPAIADGVCKLGGDVVIAKQDETGNFRTVIVLRKHAAAALPGGSGAPTPTPTPTPTPAPAPAP